MFVKFKGFKYYISLKFKYCYNDILVHSLKKKNLQENSEIFFSK